MNVDRIESEPAHLLRRAGALLYDLLLNAALWMLTGFAVLAFRGGDAIPTGTIWFQCLLFGVTACFFVGFWVRGGQTLGMMAWRIKLVARTGGPVDLPTSVRRFLVACISFLCFGLGFLWALIDPKRLTWHDRISGTRIVLLPKRS
jgi:uncharacterized RDD family membrane protein YckC